MEDKPKIIIIGNGGAGKSNAILLAEAQASKNNIELVNVSNDDEASKERGVKIIKAYESAFKIYPITDDIRNLTEFQIRKEDLRSHPGDFKRKRRRRKRNF